MTRAYHTPQGDPCARCKRPASAHRVRHAHVGSRTRPCETCGLMSYQHRPHRTPAPENYPIGIDGEGVGRDDHRYVLLARAAENETHAAHIEAPPGGRLSTKACLDFILDTPGKARLFAYAFHYDLTHILRDLPNGQIYRLFRPELRLGGSEKNPKPQPIVWRGYSLNLVSRKFTVSRKGRRRVIWDIFAFFQCRFTTALQRWKVKDDSELAEMKRLKSLRSEFDKLSSDEVGAYCLDECAQLATLARKLLQAHTDAGLQLRSYYGAGSSASAALKKWGIAKRKRDTPEDMKLPVASAFFGGRFENSVIGKTEPLWGYDISSAYPYQAYQLPCLDCGTWVRTYNPQLNPGTIALHRCTVRRVSGDWGPLPFRTEEGSIAFPREHGGGWYWHSEVFAARQLFGKRVQIHETWEYHTECDHRPFREVPALYLERLRIGKEGAGLSIKLALNSLYGKLAQSLGRAPPFQCWIWAGLITAGTRAQILELMTCYSSPQAVKMVATDGVYGNEQVDPPLPVDTGTHNDFGKPLGGWEESPNALQYFAARPGIYFPLDAANADKIRARGVGRVAMAQQFQRAIDAFEDGQQLVTLANVSRFHGAKNSVSKSASRYTRSPLYGQWRQKEIQLSFAPLPKRASIESGGRLTLRSFAGESRPYDPALACPETLQLKELAESLQEQPDGAAFSIWED